MPSDGMVMHELQPRMLFICKSSACEFSALLGVKCSGIAQGREGQAGGCAYATTLARKVDCAEGVSSDADHLENVDHLPESHENGNVRLARAHRCRRRWLAAQCPLSCPSSLLPSAVSPHCFQHQRLHQHHKPALQPKAQPRTWLLTQPLHGTSRCTHFPTRCW